MKMRRTGGHFRLTVPDPRRLMPPSPARRQRLHNVKADRASRFARSLCSPRVRVHCAHPVACTAGLTPHVSVRMNESNWEPDMDRTGTVGPSDCGVALVKTPMLRVQMSW